MPVVTRSCGRNPSRKRIEDPTPRPCRTTAKRRKEASDEENEKPPRKKPSIDIQTETAPKTVSNNKKNERLKISRIPRRCLTEKKSVKMKNQITNNKDAVDDDDDDTIQFKTTVEEKKAESQQATHVPCTQQQTPVASRTRAYSALKRSYMRKKHNQEVNKANVMELSSTSTESENSGENSLEERESEDKTPYQVKEIDSSTCNDENMNSNDEEKNDHYYKKKFHEVVESLKQVQEEFSQAHQKTRENITAYDTFIKELKASLEQEKVKNATIEEELKEAREQLLMTQKEIESSKANEQLHENRSISTTSISQEPSQSEESNQQSELMKLERAETSTLLAMIKFYVGLTGITLSTDIPPSNSELIESFLCAYRPKGPNGQVMQFRLTHDKEFEEYEYSPSFQTPKREDFLHKLPKHLKENIYFSTDQAQSFLSSLIKAVQKV